MQREKKNLNISQLAYKTNYSRAYLSQIENGNVNGSEKLELAIKHIFSCLNLDYDKFKAENNELEHKIDLLLECILLYSNENREDLYEQLRNKEEIITSCSFFPRYCLCKMVYNVTLKKYALTDEMEEIKNILLDCSNMFNTYDQAILFTYIGIYFRDNLDIQKSEKYLNKALCYGEINKIAGITYYQLSITQSVMNKLVPAYSNIEKANKRFYEEKNLKRYVFSYAQQAIILGKSKDYDQALKIFYELLSNYKLSDKLIYTININISQIHILMKNYKKAHEILNTLSIVNDNAIFMILQAYYHSGEKSNFNNYYMENKNLIKNISFQQQAQILWFKNNKKCTSNEYISILLNNLTFVKSYNDIDMELFVLKNLVEYYDSKNKYKTSNIYLKKIIAILEM